MACDEQRAAKSLVLAVLLWASMASAGGRDVLASRQDDQRTGASLSETLLTPSSVKNGFGKLFAYDLSYGASPGGDVYAQPLYVYHLGLPNRGVVNLLLVATTNNFVFAFDADGPRQGTDGVLWKRTLGQPPSMEDVWKNCSVKSPCIAHGENIRGNVGIMSTPVIDRSRGIVFLVSRVLEAPERIVYRLHGLDLRTGADRPGSPKQIAANVSGIQFNPNVHNQRPGLALARGQVIIAWGAHADFLRYRGWIMSYRYDNAGSFTQTGALVTTPGGKTSATCAVGSFPAAANKCAHGGIWMSGRAPAVDKDGQLLLMVGQGKNDMSASNPRNFGNSLLKLDAVTLAVLDFYTPANHLMLNAADLDLGGSGPMIVPESNFVIGGGKEGVMYVWRLDNLGKFSPTDASVVQKFAAGIVQSHNDTGNDMPGGAVIGGILISAHAGHIMGGPVYWPRPESVGGSRLFNWSENSELRAYKIDPQARAPVTLPAALGPDLQEGHPGGILTLSANPFDPSSGIVWAATYDATGTSIPLLSVTGALVKVRPGTLRAYSAETLARLWTSDDTPGRDRLGNFAKFNPPTVANGRVYMATFSNELVVYGLLNHSYTRPSATILPQAMGVLFDDD